MRIVVRLLLLFLFFPICSNKEKITYLPPIWDAIKGNWDTFIGTVLIPDLKQLDPTRIWDAGYMTSEHMTLDWFAHCFAPSAVFIDLVDERYTKHVPPHAPGSDLLFNLVGVNDRGRAVGGRVLVRLLDARGDEVRAHSLLVSIPAYGKQYLPTRLLLPEGSGGYLVLAEYSPGLSESPSPVLSRRYIKVGEKDKYTFFDYKPEPLKY